MLIKLHIPSDNVHSSMSNAEFSHQLIFEKYSNKNNKHNSYQFKCSS
jgi:hypothetical protein